MSPRQGLFRLLPTIGLALVSLGALPLSAAHAQEGHWTAGVSVRATLLEGDVEDFLGGGFGGGVHITRRWSTSAGVRFGVEFLALDEDDPVGGDATNRLLSFTLGPDLSTLAGPIALYARPLLGLVRSLKEGGRNTSSRRNDWAAGYGGAVGVRIFIDRGSLEVGADVLRVGELEFARSSTFTGSISPEELTAISAHIMVTLPLQ